MIGMLCFKAFRFLPQAIMNAFCFFSPCTSLTLFVIGIFQLYKSSMPTSLRAEEYIHIHTTVPRLVLNHCYPTTFITLLRISTELCNRDNIFCLRKQIHSTNYTTPSQCFFSITMPYNFLRTGYKLMIFHTHCT